MLNRVSLLISGESGLGIDSSGQIVMKSLKNQGFQVYGEREFPSLIKGGTANIQINFSQNPVRSSCSTVDIAVAVDREGLIDAMNKLKQGGILINGFERHAKVVKNLAQVVETKNLSLIQLPARTLANEAGGGAVMANMALLGCLWKILGLEIFTLTSQIEKTFAKKPALLPINIAVATGGYNYIFDADLSQNLIFSHIQTITSNASQSPQNREKMILDGNSALAMGAIAGGLRNYYAYPMSPSTSVLGYLASTCEQTGVVIKQAEDEITAVQMALGSMFAGSRAFVTTSGGGFDLMTETISLAGMIENPLVVAIAQRPGPATGLPTWTGQSDVNLAIFSGHGEYAKIVASCSDPADCFEMIQNSFNMAEKYQVPVILLTEASIAMTYQTVDPSELKQLPIERGLVEKNELETITGDQRYKITDSGLSKRWLPGQNEAYYFANGDEHWEQGELTEEGEKVRQMYAKRMLKMDTIAMELPKAEIYGVKSNAKISCVGYGSTKKIALDILAELEGRGIPANYLHYSYLWPLDVLSFKLFQESNQNLVILEGNYEGQFAKLLETHSGVKFDKKILKWDGRPFFFDELMAQIDEWIGRTQL